MDRDVGLDTQLGSIFSILGVVLVVVATCVSSYFITVSAYSGPHGVSSPILIVTLAFLIAFVIGSVFMQVLDMSIQTMLHCFVADAEAHNGRPIYISHSADFARCVASALLWLRACSNSSWCDTVVQCCAQTGARTRLECAARASLCHRNAECCCGAEKSLHLAKAASRWSCRDEVAALLWIEEILSVSIDGQRGNHSTGMLLSALRKARNTAHGRTDGLIPAPPTHDSTAQPWHSERMHALGNTTCHTYMAVITAWYFFLATFRFSLKVGVSTPFSDVHSSGSR